MIKCSIGICVYNEEKNIGRLLKSLLKQKLVSVEICEILLIASGSTDKTCEIVEYYKKRDKRIKLLKQKKREGKASAVNVFIEESRNEVLVLSSGDLIIRNDVIEKLVNKFTDTEVGMTGAHPVPVNKIRDGFCGFAGHMLWDLHHRVSLQSPKMGELIAFRKVFKRIPIYIGADEASIEPLILGQGYIIKYVPNAKIFNKTPTTLSELVKQRRRNFWLHLAVKHKQHYIVSTLNQFLVFRAILSFLKDNPKPSYFLLTLLVIMLEVYSRFLGWWDYTIVKKKHYTWEIIESTKNP